MILRHWRAVTIVVAKSVADAQTMLESPHD